MSVFSKDDLIRAVKYISDAEVKDRLVEDALSNKAVVALYNEDGTKTQYFTTDEVRREEEKILRLSGYVANLDNIFKSSNRSSYIDGHLKEAAKILSNEQYIALSELVNSACGLSILRGRAGVGKSFVLKQLAEIANKNNIHAIGLSPTHKAKEVLASSGFKSCETVKGMLFKLANGRFSLPKHSILVVDEAGMIGNDDYHELLRVAATRKCSVILSGDERQLASVQRGGMFEVFARIYGSSTIFDIKRQSNNWGREVAQEFSVGNAGSGISILEQGDARCRRHVIQPDFMKRALGKQFCRRLADGLAFFLIGFLHAILAWRLPVYFDAYYTDRQNR
ncbi:MAG: conjugal transfer protein TraA [Chitinophagia bacterium]|nr:conjugal transfer protein TraA [Chitinophagia bacterium]